MFSSLETCLVWIEIMFKTKQKTIIVRSLTLLTYPLLIFQQLCPFNRDKINFFFIRVLKFHDFYLDNTIYKMP